MRCGQALAPACPSPTHVVGQLLRLDGGVRRLAVHVALLQHVRLQKRGQAHDSEGVSALPATFALYTAIGAAATGAASSSSSSSHPPGLHTRPGQPSPAQHSPAAGQQPSSLQRSRPCRWWSRRGTQSGTQGPRAACREPGAGPRVGMRAKPPADESMAPAPQPSKALLPLKHHSRAPLTWCPGRSCGSTPTAAASPAWPQRSCGLRRINGEEGGLSKVPARGTASGRAAAPSQHGQASLHCYSQVSS